MIEQEHIATETWRLTPDLMCILDRSGAFVAVNPAWENTLGWRPDEIVGKTFPEFLHPDDLERSLLAFEDVKQGNPVLRFENRYRTKDGDHRWFSWVAVPEGDLFYCTIRDVTDVRMQDDTIRDQRIEADLREQFLAILGHDLRNPLMALMSGIRILLRQDDRRGSEELLQKMQASALRMAELTSNMMDFARVRLGDGIGLDRDLSPKLSNEIEGLVAEMVSAYPDADIIVANDLDSPVYCDTPRVMQVLSNLLGNAITHGASGSPIQVRSRIRDGRFVLSVSNKGKPISDLSRQNLFQPFFKGGERPSQQGLGLGLYICSQIAAAHGGDLSVTSDPSETVFEFSIPAAS